MGKTHNYDNFLGYIRIDGPDIEAGRVDLQSVKHTVYGTDKVFKHFLARHDSSFGGEKEANFPIEIRQGCWEIVIPVGAIATIGAVIARPASAYLTEAAKSLGKNDVGNKTSRDVLVSTIKSAQSAIKIAKHLGTMKHRHDLDARVQSADHIELRNKRGEVIKVTKQELEDYQTTPKDLFSDISYAALDERSVHIGYIINGKPNDQSISSHDRTIFLPSDDEKDELFPELEHGKEVIIEGIVTRGNQRTNTIGFEYKGHILTCSPINKYVSNFLSAHYNKCIMKGIVSRQNEEGEDNGRPRIHFTNLDVISDQIDTPQQRLL